MRKGFITYAHEDIEFAKRLASDLDSADLHIIFDEKFLRPGDSLMRLFSEIADSNYLLPILSSNSVLSNWVKKELRVAIIKSIEEGPELFNVIPIVKPTENWESIKELMPSDLREALRDIYVARFDIKTYAEAFKELLKALQPDPTPQDVYDKIEAPDTDNPFRRVRTEYINSQQIARLFTQPESSRYDRITDIRPTLIEGGRGSGKTMILRSLQATVAVNRMKVNAFSETRLSYFGVYGRLSRDSFATQIGCITDHVAIDTVTLIFQSELILKLVLSSIDELTNCASNRMINLSAEHERTIASDISSLIVPDISRDTLPKEFRGLRDLINNKLRLLQEYLDRKIFGESPIYGSVFLRRQELERVCRSITNTIPELSQATICFLLDEYENLLEFQKTVINTLMKWSTSGGFTIKIATKKTGFRNPLTLEGQELEESHDYGLVDLDYDLSDAGHRAFYKDLLRRICKEILQVEGYRVLDIAELLEDNSAFYDKYLLKTEELVAQVVVSKLGGNWEEFDEEKRREYFHRYRPAALYRIARQNRTKMPFAGFEEMAMLSSGIIRCFLELCAMSYYFATQDSDRIKDGHKIGVKHQTSAVYALSGYYLATIRKNVALYGPRIYNLLIDLGDIFRHKLIFHTSEPEAARLSISDPQNLEDSLLVDVLNSAELHTIFHVSSGLSGMRPKHPTDPQPRDYIVNRIYSPVLGFSPRPRWRTSFTCDDLSGLLDSARRNITKSKLIKKHGRSPAKGRQSAKSSVYNGGYSLFERKAPEDD